jgi:hypothetical protein
LKLFLDPKHVNDTHFEISDRLDCIEENKFYELEIIVLKIKNMEHQILHIEVLNNNLRSTYSPFRILYRDVPGGK